MKEDEVAAVEDRLKDSLKRKVKLNLQQILVQPGGLKEQKVKAVLEPAIVPPKPPAEIIRMSREGMLSVIRQSTEKIEKMIAPSTIADFKVGFNDKSFTVSVVMKVKRDTPLSGDEILWLRRILAIDLNVPVDLSIETVPFVPLLIFQKGETTLTPEMKKTILTIKDICEKNQDAGILVEAYAGAYDLPKKVMKLSNERVQQVKDLLVKECNIHSENIDAEVIKSRKIEAPAVKISLLFGGNNRMDTERDRRNHSVLPQAKGEKLQ